MAKKVHEVAKELGVQSKDVIAFLSEKGIDKKPASNLDDSEIVLVNSKFGKAAKPAEKPVKADKNDKTETKQKTDKSVEKKQDKPAEKPVEKETEKPKTNTASTTDRDTNDAPKKLRPVSVDGRPVMPDGRRPGQSQTSTVKRPVAVDGRPVMPDGRRPMQGQQGQRPMQGQRPVNGSSNGQKIDIPKDKAPSSSFRFGDPEKPNRQQPKQPVQQPAQTQPIEKKPVQQPVQPEPVKPVAPAEPVKPAAGTDFLIGKNQSSVVIKGNVFEEMNRREEEKKKLRQQNAQNERPERNERNDRGDRKPYQGNRDGQQGDRRPYQGNRDGQQGDRRPYQGNRDGQQGDRKPYQGNRDGQQGDRKPYQGNRDGQQGSRSFGQNRNGGMPGFVPKDGDEPTHSYKANKNEHSRKSNAANEISAKGNSTSKRNDRLANRKAYDGGKNYEDDDLKGSKKKDPKRAGAFQKPVAKAVEAEDDIKVITIPDSLTIKDLADQLKKNAAEIIKKLFMQGKMVSLNQEISFEEAEEIASDYDCLCEHEVKVNIIEELMKDTEDPESSLVSRPPVVCVMGHVDHGKTSLLDAIRSTNVTAREAGGITQHIGASVIEINGRKITFLDTPGHEAFTSMRLRGAKSTDIAILVVAADDGVMPQTVEAINHAKAAGIQIIVAVNKIDKPAANVERVKQELTEHGLVAEDWGGDTIFAPVSAKTHEGIEQLLEMVLLTADMLELKANPDRRARGIVIEAELDKGRGPVATILVQKGTLHQGDIISIGSAFGKVRAMTDDKGRRVKEATPSTPVEVIGLNEVPGAGDLFIVTDGEKEAREISEAFISQGKEKLIADTKAKLSLDGLFSQIKAGNIKELNIIIKADVQGSVEAMKQSLLKLSNDEVAVRIIHSGVGAINESDVTLASASNAIIIGFNVKPDNTAKDIAEHEKVDVRLYRVIYNAIEDIENAMKGMLDPIFEEKIIAHAEIRQIFKASGVGSIAGSFVLDGKVTRNASARITRNGEQIFDGKIATLKRFKDDVKEVAAGYECGIVFEKFNDLQELDIAEFYVMVEVPRK